jgi:hypothetical protein
VLPGILRRLRSLAIADEQKINMICVSSPLHPIAADASAAASCDRKVTWLSWQICPRRHDVRDLSKNALPTAAEARVRLSAANLGARHSRFRGAHSLERHALPFSAACSAVGGGDCVRRLETCCALRHRSRVWIRTRVERKAHLVLAWLPEFTIARSRVWSTEHALRPRAWREKPPPLTASAALPRWPNAQTIEA